MHPMTIWIVGGVVAATIIAWYYVKEVIWPQVGANQDDEELMFDCLIGLFLVTAVFFIWPFAIFWILSRLLVVLLPKLKRAHQ